MRSRTELVTTTFIDSEEDQTESEDSEEDWRPVSSRNGKKRSVRGSSGRGRGRRARGSGRSGSRRKVKRRRRQHKESEEDDEDADDDDDDFEVGHDGSDEQDYDGGFGGATTTTTTAAQLLHVNRMQNSSGIPDESAPAIPTPEVVIEQKPLQRKLPPEKSFPDRNGTFNLYVYKNDLSKDYRTNSRLCLWRRDGSSLLQKYIRIKTANSNDFIFTSSSVYSSWDEKRRKDFKIIEVKCLEENNRRVKIFSMDALHSLVEEVSQQKTINAGRGDADQTGDSIIGSQDEQQYEDEGEEEEEDEEDLDEEDGSSYDDNRKEETTADAETDRNRGNDGSGDVNEEVSAKSSEAEEEYGNDDDEVDGELAGNNTSRSRSGNGVSGGETANKITSQNATESSRGRSGDDGTTNGENLRGGGDDSDDVGGNTNGTQFE